MSQDHVKPTKLGKSNAGSVAIEAWFDEIEGSLWVEAKDGERVCIPKDRIPKLKKLINRGRNP